jgi:ubiquinone/menaquinone biosynthesis C-methylase UbiE
MRLLNWTHDRVVHAWRVEALRRSLAPMVPEGAFVLDVGCGDGLLAGDSRRATAAAWKAWTCYRVLRHIS